MTQFLLPKLILIPSYLFANNTKGKAGANFTAIGGKKKEELDFVSIENNLVRTSYYSYGEESTLLFGFKGTWDTSLVVYCLKTSAL